MKKTTKSKKPKTSTGYVPITKNVDWKHPIYQWREKPVSETYIAKLAEELIEECVNNTKLYTIDQFLVKHNLISTTYERWCKKFEQLGEAHEFAKMVLGARRESGALENNLNASMVQYVMPHYSKTWRDMTEWRSSLKQQPENQGSTIIIDKPCYNSCCSKEKK